MLNSKTVDLSNCDREPIHQLGAIQPLGFLLAVGTDWLVARASANIAQFVGKTPDDVLGRPLTELLESQAVHDLRNMAAMLRGADAVERSFATKLTDDGQRYDVAVHFVGKLLVIEAEPSAGDRGDASSMVRSMMSRVRLLRSTSEFLQEASRQVRALTGFDRVMVYRFDKTGSGEVVAESRRSGVDSFLGLNYPASDIPAQARSLYLRNIFRIIVDVDAKPAMIVPQFDFDGAPLDLSMSVLRAVSPIHIEYLRNMGVGASLSISIIVEGRLWGLFACHHYGAKRTNFVERTAAELFGSMFSLMLESRERAADAEYEEKARAVSDRLLSVIAEDADQMADAEWFGSVVADAIPSDGVGVHVGGVTSLSGLTPDEGQFRGIMSLLNRNASGEIFTTDNIASLIPEAAAYAGRSAGLLAIPISRSPRDYVVLFRSERLRNVRWAGNPEKPVEFGPNGARLTPRKSFEEWSELVKGKAMPFTDPEQRIANTLRGALLEVVLRLTDAAGEERRKAEERQTLLIAELNHRVRNILALVRGLVSQTRQSGGDAQEMMQTLDLRVQALARAHDQVSADRMAPASLTALIETEASAYLGAKRERVRIQGKDVKLAPEAFTIMALVVHELVTNAAKYGALSDSGSVQIAWSRDRDGDLLLTWREIGGPAVTAPTRRGFGSTIIERSVPHELGGQASVRYRVTGFEADFTVPARYVTEAERNTAPEPHAAKRQPAPASPLKDKAVLLVEDSLMIALECEASLLQLGAREVMMASSVEEARALLAAQAVDLAVLDFNLGGENSMPIADTLIERSIPVIFATGYGEALALPSQYSGTRTVVKPYTTAELQQAVAELLG
jgi:light-regulated signal transduction histidine kinase (bacteriophytochrome)/CheY-like chemotaxis protein